MSNDCRWVESRLEDFLSEVPIGKFEHASNHTSKRAAHAGRRWKDTVRSTRGCVLILTINLSGRKVALA